jgi:iodothyronine deiodinase-like protein
MESNREEKLVFNQPRTFDERQELAKILVERLKYRMPVAIDAIDNRADKAFAAWPERIYVIEPGGRVAFKGEMGPFGFHPDEAEKALAALVASSGAGG